MTTVFDEYIVMKDEEAYKGVDETLEKLDEMLTAYGIKHSFILPFLSVLEETPNAAAVLCYEGKDSMTVSLIYALFCKVHREVDDERLTECLVKIASNHTSGK